MQQPIKSSTNFTAPNIITMIRFTMAPLFMAAMSRHPLYGLLILTIAAFSDWLDGHLARKYQTQTELGALLDPLADKAMSLACLMVINIKLQNLTIVLASAIIIIRDLVLSYFRVRSQILNHKNSALKVSKIGKFKTALLFLSQIILIFYLYCDIGLGYRVGSVLLYVSSLLTLVSFWLYTKQSEKLNIRLLRE